LTVSRMSAVLAVQTDGSGEYVGLVPIAEAFYEVYYGPVLLGWFDEKEYYFAPRPVITHWFT
jgi:hypothetical protein